MPQTSLSKPTWMIEEQKSKDRFAMDFAIWLYNLKLEIIDRNSIEQLLTIYKKENEH